MNDFWINLITTVVVVFGIPWLFRRYKTRGVMIRGGVIHGGTVSDARQSPKMKAIRKTQPTTSQTNHHHPKEKTEKKKPLKVSSVRQSSRILDEDKEIERRISSSETISDNCQEINDSDPKVMVDSVTKKKEGIKTKQKKKSSVSRKQQQPQQQNEVVFQQTSSQHPGLQGFYHWQDALSSIYRVYQIGSTTQDGMIIPMQPRSERGYTPIELQVKNELDHPIHVYWLGFKGEEKPRGIIEPYDVWYQTTWIGHPWIFKYQEKLLVHFVPYRAIPSTAKAPTTTSSEDNTTAPVGIHCFSIQKPTFVSMSQNHICHIHDPIFPLPGDISRIEKAITWCCRQYEREQVIYENSSCIRTLLQYLQNIVDHAYDDDTPYRRIRIANPIFQNQIWITAGRGVLHALGFVDHGAHLELGPLPNRHSLINNAIFSLKQLLVVPNQQPINNNNNDDNNHLQQPRGIDGSGRANFGI